MSVIVLTVSNSQIYSNDEFDLWTVYSGERFRAFRPSCLRMKTLGFTPFELLPLDGLCFNFVSKIFLPPN